jgi:hypothetical protein
MGLLSSRFYDDGGGFRISLWTYHIVQFHKHILVFFYRPIKSVYVHRRIFNTVFKKFMPLCESHMKLGQILQIYVAVNFEVPSAPLCI